MFFMFLMEGAAFPVVLYGLYLLFLGLSFRYASLALSPSCGGVMWVEVDSALMERAIQSLKEGLNASTTTSHAGGRDATYNTSGDC
jgi:hypothetical protein